VRARADGTVWEPGRGFTRVVAPIDPDDDLSDA
jgi:hypothetical protein